MNTHAPVGATRTTGPSTHKTAGSASSATATGGAATAGGALFASLLSDASETGELDGGESMSPGSAKTRKTLALGLLPEAGSVDPLSVPLPGAQPSAGAQPLPAVAPQGLAPEGSVLGAGQNRSVGEAAQGHIDLGAVSSQGSAPRSGQGLTLGDQDKGTGLEVPALVDGAAAPGLAGAAVVPASGDATLRAADSPQEGGVARSAASGVRPQSPLTPPSGTTESTVARWAGAAEAIAPGNRSIVVGAKQEARLRPVGVSDVRSDGRLSAASWSESAANEAGLSASNWVAAVQGGEPVSGVSSKPAEIRQDVMPSRTADEGQLGVPAAPETSATGDTTGMTPALPLDDLASQVAYLSSQGVQSAQLTVETEGGEQVEVRVDLVGNEAQVAFRSDVPETRAALERASDQLQGLLAKEGLVLSGVSIGAQTQQQPGGQASSQAWAERRGVSVPERLGARGFEPVSAPVRSSHQGALDIFV